MMEPIQATNSKVSAQNTTTQKTQKRPDVVYDLFKKTSTIN